MALIGLREIERDPNAEEEEEETTDDEDDEVIVFDAIQIPISKDITLNE